MKKIIILLSLILLTGCEFGNKEKEITINTTYYPIEYAVDYLYSDYSNISSIYPSEINTDSYELTKKQKEIYSNSDIFIYSGLTKEVDYAVDFLNANSNLNIIDATRGLNMENDISELWLNPANYLIIARNIKNTLKDYENNIYNIEKMEKAYEDLKISISELDVEYTMMAKNASKKSILIADDTLSYLSKYNINVLTLNPNNENYSKSVNDAKLLIASKDIKYIYTIAGKELSEDIEKYITDNNLEKIEIEPMYTLTEEERKENENYITIMRKNIDKFKTELFR